MPVDGLQHLGHPGALLRRREQVLQGGDGVLVRRAALQHLGVALHGRAGILQLLLEHLRQAQRQCVALRVVRGPPELRLQVIGQVLPALVGAEQALHLVGGGGRRAVIGVKIDDLAQRLQGAIGVAQPLLVDERAATQQRLLGLEVGGPARLLVQKLAQLQPLFPALERPLEQGRGLGIPATGVVEPPIERARFRAAVQVHVVDLGGAPHDLQHRRRILQRSRQGVGQQDPDLAPPPQAAAQAQELLQVDPLGGVLLENLAVPLQRAVVVLELLLIKAGDALGQRQPLRRIIHLLQPDLGDVNQRCPVLAAGVDGLQQLGRDAAHHWILQHAFQAW